MPVLLAPTFLGENENFVWSFSPLSMSSLALPETLALLTHSRLDLKPSISGSGYRWIRLFDRRWAKYFFPLNTSKPEILPITVISAILGNLVSRPF